MINVDELTSRLVRTEKSNKPLAWLLLVMSPFAYFISIVCVATAVLLPFTPEAKQQTPFVGLIVSILFGVFSFAAGRILRRAGLQMWYGDAELSVTLFPPTFIQVVGGLLLIAPLLILFGVCDLPLSFAAEGMLLSAGMILAGHRLRVQRLSFAKN